MKCEHLFPLPNATELDPFEEGWKELVAGSALGAALAFSPAVDAKPVSKHPVQASVKHSQSTPATKQPSVSAKSKGLTTSQAPQNKASKNEALLRATAVNAGIRGTELAAFLAQCAHESFDFTKLEEVGSAEYFNNYDPSHNKRLANILGNTKVGDGKRYKGRGFIALTGRYNYKMVGDAINVPLEQHPELAATPKVAAKIAVYFWKHRVQPKVRDFTKTADVTRQINAAGKGAPQRHEKFISYLAKYGNQTRKKA